MFPLLKAEDEVLLDPRAYRKQLPQVGNIVVAWHPQREGVKIVKRVTAVTPPTLQLKGDNPIASTDYDNIPITKIIGRVICRFG